MNEPIDQEKYSVTRQCVNFRTSFNSMFLVTYAKCVAVDRIIPSRREESAKKDKLGPKK